MKKLGQHLADWEEMIGKYGQNLMRCPEGLRTMSLGVIPKSCKDELMHKEVKCEKRWKCNIALAAQDLQL